MATMQTQVRTVESHSDPVDWAKFDMHLAKSRASTLNERVAAWRGLRSSGCRRS